MAETEHRRAYKREWDRRKAERARLDAQAREPEPPPGILWIRGPRKAGSRRSIIGRTLVDIEDWERFKDVVVYLYSNRYSAFTTDDGRTEYLHRAILGLERGSGWGQQTDHINRDTRDNRRSNLRVVTPKENCRNRGGMFAQRTSYTVKWLPGFGPDGQRKAA